MSLNWLVSEESLTVLLQLLAISHLYRCYVVLQKVSDIFSLFWNGILPKVIVFLLHYMFDTSSINTNPFINPSQNVIHQCCRILTLILPKASQIRCREDKEKNLCKSHVMVWNENVRFWGTIKIMCNCLLNRLLQGYLRTKSNQRWLRSGNVLLVRCICITLSAPVQTIRKTLFSQKISYRVHLLLAID